MFKKNKVCLIVEGGGFKTAFTAGVLDSFLGVGKTNFDGFMGVSGGSIAISYFLSKQYRFCYRAIELLAKDQHFMQYKRTFGAEGIMDIDYLEKVSSQVVPFEKEKALQAILEKDISFVATNRRFGNPEYLVPNKENWINAVIASCTLPFVTKGKHKIKGKAYFDGGWSDPLPVKEAYRRGFNEVLVLRTSPKDIKTTQSWTDYFGSIYFSKRPELSECFSKCYLMYNAAVDFMISPPEGVTVNQIAPEKYLKSGTYSYNEKTIIEDYRNGLDQGMKYLMANKSLI
ncbi:MAG: patatin family protein [Bacteroidia bacterium]|nr:patatin family protein [Bacteroidia bacterium]